MLELMKKYKSGSAAEILREAILTGDIPEGISMTQNEIAESLGTSRMPVREALISLEYQGLITRGSNQHVHVVSVNDEYIHAVFNDMALLEIEAIKDMTRENIIMLSESESQIGFHRMICACTEAPLRKKMLEIFTEVYSSFLIEHSGNVNQIDDVFMNLKKAVNEYANYADIEVIRSCYAVYSEVLSRELIRIRTKTRNET